MPDEFVATMAKSLLVPSVTLLLVEFLCLYSNLGASGRLIHLHENRIVAVDNVLPDDVLRTLYMLCSRYSSWVYRDNSSVAAIDRDYPSTGTLHWMSYLDPDYIRTTQLWRTVVDVLKELHGDLEYYPVRINTFQIRRLDAMKVMRECESGGSDHGRHSDTLMTLYLNKQWEKNDYGELILYNETTREVAVSAVPRHGRLLVWDCDIPYTYKPPSIAYKQGQYGLVLRVSQSNSSFEWAKSFYQRLRQDREEKEKVDFSLTVQHGLRMSDNTDVAPYRARLFRDSKGKPVAVYDKLFSDEEIHRLRTDLVKMYNKFRYQPFDESVIEDNDNVPWIIPIRVAHFVRTPLWNVFLHITEDLTGISDWYPYDISINVIRGADHTRIHADCEEWEDEYTLLLYLNPELDTPDSHGETAFFEEIKPLSALDYRHGNEVYEMVAAVRPRFGRVAIFNGLIPHSARPPSIRFTGTRYTFAVKVMRTERVALSKTLQELLEDGIYEEQSPENTQLLDMLYNGLAHQKSHSLLPPVEVLRDKVIYLEENRDQTVSQRHEKSLRKIERLLKAGAEQ